MRSIRNVRTAASSNFRSRSSKSSRVARRGFEARLSQPSRFRPERPRRFAPFGASACAANSRLRRSRAPGLELAWALAVSFSPRPTPDDRAIQQDVTTRGSLSRVEGSYEASAPFRPRAAEMLPTGSTLCGRRAQRRGPGNGPNIGPARLRSTDPKGLCDSRRSLQPSGGARPRAYPATRPRAFSSRSRQTRGGA